MLHQFDPRRCAQRMMLSTPNITISDRPHLILDTRIQTHHNSKHEKPTAARGYTTEGITIRITNTARLDAPAVHGWHVACYRPGQRRLPQAGPSTGLGRQAPRQPASPLLPAPQHGSEHRTRNSGFSNNIGPLPASYGRRGDNLRHHLCPRPQRGSENRTVNAGFSSMVGPPNLR